MLNLKKMKFQILIILLALAATLTSAAGPLTIGQLTDILNDLNSIQDQPDYLYLVLNLPATADLPQIKKRYHELLFKYHPDRYSDDESSKEVATELMKRLNHAFGTLSDKYKRAEYDSQNNANAGAGVFFAGSFNFFRNSRRAPRYSPDDQFFAQSKDPQSHQLPKDMGLSRAAEYGYDNLVVEHLDAGADINNKGGRPLINAIQNGRVSTVRLLISLRAIVNIGEAGQTPLYAAVQSENVEIVKVLLEAGADVSAHNFEVLRRADIKGLFHSEQSKEIEKLLMENFKSKMANFEASPDSAKAQRIQQLKDLGLYQAAESGDDKSVVVYLNAGAEINHEGGRSLKVAIRNGDVFIIRLLISRRAIVNIGEAGQTPLYAAVQSGNVEIVKVLLEAGADVSAHNYDALKRAMKNSDNSRESKEIETMLKKNARSKMGVLKYSMLMASLKQ